MWYVFLNYFFFIFHTALIIFNVFGWIIPKLRKWHLITLLLTAASWFILGIWYGWGYCPCTDWHWDVREAMGFHDQQRSYIHFLILKLTGINFNLKTVDQATLFGFLISLSISLILNLRSYIKRNRS